MRTSDALLLVEVRRALTDGSARKVRARAGLTQAEAGSACGVTAAAISRWESGARAPRGPAALRYGRLLRRLREVTGAAA